MDIVVDGERCLDSLEAARRLGLHPSKLSRVAGRLRIKRFYGLLIPEGELNKYIEERAIQKTSA